jgi:hypothetical protein
MTTCPWCGTSYSVFQSSCSRCGGPIPVFQEGKPSSTVQELLIPPPPPRPISDNFAWKLIFSDGWAIAAFVFLLMGVIFLPLGILMSILIITAFVGLPFVGTGILFLGAGIPVFAWRFKEAQKTVRVLREGESTQGQIDEVSVNPSVAVNGRNPWTISYGFQSAGQMYAGKVITLTPPGPGLQSGMSVCILYLPGSPEVNTIYPHP